MKKRLLSLLLALTLACSLLVFPANAAEIVDSGVCGEDAAWTLTDDGVLTIRGTGSTYDYSWERAEEGYVYAFNPWQESKTPVLSVVIEPGITRIGNQTFENLDDLISITISDSVTEIGNEAFLGCHRMADMTLPGSLACIGDYAFEGCKTLNGITLPESLTYIGDHAFEHCTIKSITIPDGVTHIGDYAFNECASLKEVVLPENITQIGNGVFKSCRLTSVTLPASIVSIGDEAFGGCDLTNVELLGNVPDIHKDAFSHCSKIKTITLGPGVTDVSWLSAFDSCRLLNAFEVHPENRHYSSSDGILYSKNQVTLIRCPKSKSGTITLPPCVTRIADDAFSGCSGVIGVHLPPALISIGARAFSGTGLISVRIPLHVRVIGESAFASCSRIREVAFSGRLETIRANAFSDTSVATVYFSGSEEEWEKISIAGGNTSLTVDTQMHWNVADPDDHIKKAFAAPTDTEDGYVESYCSCGFRWGYTTIPSPKEHFDHTPSFVTIGEQIITDSGERWEKCYCAVCGEVGYIRLTDLPPTYETITEPATRIGICRLFWKMAGCPEPAATENPFRDMQDGTDDAKAAVWAVEHSITNGTSESTFSPDDKCIRAHVATFIWRFLADGERYEGQNPFIDVSTDDYYYTPVGWCCENGFLETELGQKRFDPFDMVAHVTYDPTLGQFLPAAEHSWDAGVVTIEPAKTSEGEARFTCLDCGQTKTEVIPPTGPVPVITMQPKAYSGKVNTTASFTVSAEGEGLTYQWQFSNDGKTWRNSSVHTAKYSTKLTADKDGWLVRCIITNQIGNSVISQTARMRIVTIVITAQPQNFTGPLNSTVPFSVEAEGDGLTYQWQISDTNGGKWSNSSVKSPVYTTKLTSARDGRMVRCVIFDENDKYVVSDAAVMRLAVIAITGQPEDYVGSVNDSAVFRVSAEGEGLAYQWQYSDNGGRTWSNSSVKTAKYSTKLTSARDGRMVRCVITDAYGSKMATNAAVMRIKNDLSITAQPKNYVGTVNSTAKFTVAASGDGLTYQWQISDNGGKSWSNSSVKSAVYSTKLTASRDGRMVRCVVSDHYGNSVATKAVSMTIG